MVAAMPTTKTLSLDALQELARQMTAKALEAYVVPEDVRTQLVLGVFFEESSRIFELYVPGDRPSDARVITRATLNSEDGTGTVEVFKLQPKTNETD